MKLKKMKKKDNKSVFEMKANLLQTLRSSDVRENCENLICISMLWASNNESSSEGKNDPVSISRRF